MPKKGCNTYLQLNVNHQREFRLSLTALPLARLKWCLLPQPRLKWARAPSDGTNRQRAPSVCLCGLIWPRPAQGASWGTAWKRSGVSHLSERGESVSLQISRSFTSLGGFISLLCSNTCWLPSCFAVIYNSAPLEFAEIPKATAQIR